MYPLHDAITLSWLTGPIFDKELRVASRHRHTYWMRAAYILILGALVAFLWLQMQLLGATASQSRRMVEMAEMARLFSLIMVWLQFITLHLVALALAGGGLNEEAQRGTLAALMTTPIRPLQIVLGKLAAGLMQPLVLLAVGVPVLAMFRVFGGIDWQTVWDGFWITIAAAFSVGAVTLWFSMKTRHAHVAMLRAAVVIGVAWVVLGMLPFWLPAASGLRLVRWGLISPLGALGLLTNRARYPGLVMGFSLSAHCLIVLLVGAAFVGLTARHMRVALGRHMGPAPERGRIRVALFDRGVRTDAAISPVTAAPILWREWIHAGQRRTWVMAVLFIVVSLGLTVPVAIFFPAWAVAQVQSLLSTGFFLLVMFRTLAMACTTIIAEKDGRTWPLLLTSLQDDARIVRHKALAVLARNAPLWLALLISQIAQAVVQLYASTATAGTSTSILDESAFAIVFFVIRVINSLVSCLAFPVLVVGIGLYTGLRCKRRTAAIGLGIVVILAVQIGLVVVMGLLTMAMFPLFMIFDVNAAFFYIPIAISQLATIVLTSGCFLGLGLLLASRTRKRLRACVL